MRPTERFHALDNLRALMMWLGIVLHVAMQHLADIEVDFWRDPERTPLADVMFTFIHSFRMPVFFIVAGFFVALLAQRYGRWGMLRHRARRLALPFVIFWPMLFYLTAFWW